MGAAASVGEQCPKFETLMTDTESTMATSFNEILLTLKMLALCEMSYVVKHDEDEAVVASYKEQLHITEYKLWYAPMLATVQEAVGEDDNDTEKLNNEKIQPVGGAMAISGIISNLTPEYPNSQVFICFRGTSSMADMLDEAGSASATEFVTSKNNKIGGCGAGFLNHYKAILSLRLSSSSISDANNIDTTEATMSIIDHAIDLARANKCGIFVTGHSLGAAVASLCATELFLDYNKHITDEAEKVTVQQVTFGSPRVFDESTAQEVHNLALKHIRFVNEGDLMTVLGDQGINALCHTGQPVFISGKQDVLILRTSEGSTVKASNFPKDPSTKGTMELLHSFVQHAADAHCVVTPGGYADKLANAPIVTDQLMSLPEPFTASFAWINEKFRRAGSNPTVSGHGHLISSHGGTHLPAATSTVIVTDTVTVTTEHQ